MANRYRPDKCGVIVSTSAIENTLQLHVDPDRPNALDEEPGKNVVEYLHSCGWHLLILIRDERYFYQAEDKPLPQDIVPIP